VLRGDGAELVGGVREEADAAVHFLCKVATVLLCSNSLFGHGRWLL
jgi:hypothetical protein